MPAHGSFPAQGGCDCRSMRCRMETAPMFVGCCHCRWCQRETGASFALNALIEADRMANAGAGAAVKFVRDGTLDNPDLLSPDVHIYTASRQPWLALAPGVPAFAEYYEREQLWPAASLARRQAIVHLIQAHRAAL